VVFYISDVLDYIDYGQTKFYICDMLDTKIKDCTVNSTGDLKNLKDILPDEINVASDYLYFNKDFANMYDLFKINIGDYKTYISENLKKSFELSNVTGLSINYSENIQIG
jgi:hypothetical protein